MNALEIFFIAIAFNCLMFFGLCVYSTFLNKKEKKINTTIYRTLPYNHKYRIKNDFYYKGDIYKNIEETPILFGHGFKVMTEEEQKEYIAGLEQLNESSVFLNFKEDDKNESKDEA